MIIVGLTGSIGMGKTTTGNLLKSMGCAVYDSDLGVKKALEPYGKAFEAVALTFPKAWDKKKRVINKEKLAEIIFYDAQKKQKLENILHPIVQEEQQHYILAEKQKGRDIVVLDIPLLFETGAQDRVDYTIAVTAPVYIQAQRVLSRPGMSEEKVESIKKSQMPDAQKCALADYVVQTGLGKAHTMKQLKNILRDIKA